MSEVPFLSEVVPELRAAWAMAKKDMVIYYIKPNIIVSGLLFPLFMFLAFSVGSTSSAAAMIPGLIALTILFSASSIEPVSIPIERRMKTFDRLLSAPVSINAIVLGESISGFLYGLGIALVPLAAGLILFSMQITSVLPLIVGMVLATFVISSMGTLFAAYPTESPGDIMSILNLVRLPMIFISGVFLPLTAIPEAWRFITYLSPMTYGYDLISLAYTGTSHIDPLIDVAVLLVFILLFQLLSDWLYKRYNA